MNWWRCFENPLPVREIAELAVEEWLVKAFDIPRVDCLVYKAFLRFEGRTSFFRLLPSSGTPRARRF